jgi:hypothetical protein
MAGVFTISVPGNRIGGFDVGDLNGDGLLDLVVQEDDTPSYDVRTRLLLGAKTGFETAVEIAKALYGGAVVVADVNADGLDDAVLLHQGEWTIGVVLSTGAGTESEVSYMVNTGAFLSTSALAVGDIDCDGCPDVVVAPGGGLAIFHGRGCGP